MKKILNEKTISVCQTWIVIAKLYKKISEQLRQDLKKVILIVTESNQGTEEQRKLFGKNVV